MDMRPITGYQQGIMYLLGSQNGERFVVRSVARHYIDIVRPCFPANVHPYLQRRADGKQDYWCLKSAAVKKPSLSDVRDYPGFCRAFIELQGTLDLHKLKGVMRPRLRLYGTDCDLSFVAAHLPALPKKMQIVRTNNGTCYALYYQSAAEIRAIIDYISSVQGNRDIADSWAEIIGGSNN